MNRIERIKNRLFTKDFYTKIDWWGQEETILTSDEVKKEPLVVRKALGIQHLLRNMPAALKEDELIVGVPNMGSIGFGREFPEYALPEEKAEAAKSSFTVKSVAGHHPADYEKLLRVGIIGLKQEIFAKITEESSKDAPDTEKLDLWRAMLISLDAVIDLAHRYSDLCVKQAKAERNPQRAAELLEIARICNRVPEYPAETYHEALQSFFLFYLCLHSCMEQIPVGRPDQYLYPYYRKDMDAGRLTEEKARELTSSWIVKFSERVQMDSSMWEPNHMSPEDEYDGGDPNDLKLMPTMDNGEDWNFGTSANHWQMNIILGGLTPDGKDGTNELTYMILEQWAYYELVSPIMSVRFHKNTPRHLYELCAKILRCGSGEPCIYNDEVVVQGLIDAGVPVEDARNYSNDGCWEVLIPGKTDYIYMHVRVLQMLEYTLMRGESLVRKQKEARDMGDPTHFRSFEELYNACFQLITEYVDHAVITKLKYWKDRYKIAPSVLFSTLLDDCIERGLDLSNGGAHYKFYTFFLTGFANFIDSLAAIKKFVFEDKLVSMEALVQAIRTDFKDQEPLRQMLVNRAPKFGNDDSYVDSIASAFLKDFDKMVKQRAQQDDVKESGFTLSVGLGTFEHYAKFGRECGASADGRHYQETVSSNYSPAIGLDKNGPTAAIKSVTCADIIPYYTGGPLDIQINSNEVTGESGIARLSSLIESFMKLGGSMMTITGVSAELLEDAQKHPEKHQGLRVRMGGLSAYFIAMPKAQQDIIIRRTKHSV